MAKKFSPIRRHLDSKRPDIRGVGHDIRVSALTTGAAQIGRICRESSQFFECAGLEQCEAIWNRSLRILPSDGMHVALRRTVSFPWRWLLFRLKALLPFTVLVIAGCSEHGQIPPPWGVPITGGTMVVTRDGTHAVVADPDRDQIVSVDLAAGRVTSTLPLDPGDQPGRIVEDGVGRIHVALRGGNALLTLTDAVNGVVMARRPACSEPRGLAWDQTPDTIHLACNDGTLVTYPASGGNPVRTLHLDRDLRDVLVTPAGLQVTRFRTAEVLTLDAAGNVTLRSTPPTVQRFIGGVIGPVDGPGSGGTGQPGSVNAVPTVAWRTILLPDGRVVMSHQRHVLAKLDDNDDHEGGYGTNCGHGPIEASTTVMQPGQPPFAAMALARGALPVDMAVNAAGDKIAVVTAGNQRVTVAFTTQLASQDQDMCGGGDDGKDDRAMGTPTSVGWTPSNDLVIFYPEAPAIAIRAQGTGADRVIKLDGEVGYDAGRNLFHSQTRIGIACASCHPEGREDGQVWEFAQISPRRTQSLAGGLLSRGPYHWAGDMGTLGILMDDVFSVRMAGGPVTEHQRSSLGPWLDRIPAPAPSSNLDAAAVERGRAIFETTGACASCHSGVLFTNNTLVDVGKGGKFKVPSLLGVAARAPFMHDGSAATLQDRFGAAGGGDLHGNTSQLTTAQIGDLIAYLESL
jgi:mono/diheme cytochrome c family protein